MLQTNHSAFLCTLDYAECLSFLFSEGLHSSYTVAINGDRLHNQKVLTADLTAQPHPIHSFRMTRQSMRKPEQLPLEILKGSGGWNCQTLGYRTLFSIELFWILPAVLLLTVRGVFCLELVVPSDWQCTIMKEDPTQKGLETKQRERKKNHAIPNRKFLGYLHSLSFIFLPCINVGLNT